jgi:hypothetical protein
VELRVADRDGETKGALAQQPVKAPQHRLQKEQLW